MKKITLESISITNFFGTEDRFVSFGEKTVIKGRNRSGKTTIIEALAYILTGKYINGNEAVNNRPINDDRTHKNDADIKARCVLFIDGQRFEIEKIESKKFIKKTGEFKGNDTVILVNGIPKKLKDYNAWIEEHICPVDKLSFCLFADNFLMMDNKKKRESLFFLVDEITDDTVIASDPERFEPLRQVLADGTPDEIIQRDRYQLNGRGRNDHGLNGKLNDIPTQIGTILTIGTDTSSFESKKKELEASAKDVCSCIEQIESKISCAASDVEQINVQIAELTTQQLGLKSEMLKQINMINDEIKTLEQKERSVFDKKRSALRSQISAVASDKRDTLNKISSLKAKVEAMNVKLQDFKQCASEYKAKALEVSKRQFDEAKAKSCPITGETCETIDISSAKKSFNDAKKADYNALVTKCNEYIAKSKTYKEDISTVQGEISTLEKLAEKQNETFSELDGKLAFMLFVPSGELKQKYKEIEQLKADAEDVEKSEKWKEIGNKIFALTENVKGIREMIRALQDSQNEKSEELKRIEKDIAIQDNEIKNCKYRQTQVEDLQKEQSAIAQEIVHLEGEIDLCKAFVLAKTKFVTDSINSKFKHIKWVLFEPNISNDGFKEVCNPAMDGVGYSENLNGGSKLVLPVDVSVAFQNAVGVNAPIFVDEASIMTSNSMDMLKEFSDHQIILLKAEECDFTVEVGE